MKYSWHEARINVILKWQFTAQKMLRNLIFFAFSFHFYQKENCFVTSVTATKCLFRHVQLSRQTTFPLKMGRSKLQQVDSYNIENSFCPQVEMFSKYFRETVIWFCIWSVQLPESFLAAPNLRLELVCIFLK